MATTNYKPIFRLKFEEKKEEFKRLCERYNLQSPEIIIEATKDDPCDVTDVNEVRFKEYSVEDNVDGFYQVRHVFGHWLCDLHNYNNEKSDQVADIIGRLIR